MTSTPLYIRSDKELQTQTTGHTLVWQTGVLPSIHTAFQDACVESINVAKHEVSFLHPKRISPRAMKVSCDPLVSKFMSVSSLAEVFQR